MQYGSRQHLSTVDNDTLLTAREGCWWFSRTVHTKNYGKVVDACEMLYSHDQETIVSCAHAPLFWRFLRLLRSCLYDTLYCSV